jgi:hypothetical protein
VLAALEAGRLSALVFSKTSRDQPIAIEYSFYARAFYFSQITGVSTTLHSHSIVLSDDNALIYQRNFFLRILKNRIPDPSEICALEIKGEFR